MPKQAEKALTAAQIEPTRPPKSGTIEVWDADVRGFGLRVYATGRQSWVLMTRLDGRAIRRKIGDSPDMSLDDARRIARDWKKKAKAGIDPTPAAAERSAPKTFGEIADAYIAGQVPALARPDEIRALIEVHLLKPWRNRSSTSLRKRDALDITDALKASGRPAVAFRIYELVRRIFRWALSEDHIEKNPMDGLAAPVKKLPRRHPITHEELRALWQAWSGPEIGYPFGPLQRLLLVTGVRRTEAAEAQWSEIDLERRDWVIPSARNKSDREHLVPLSDLALEILETLPRFDAGPFVFSTTAGQRPVSGFSKAKLLADRVSGVAGWVMHDFRRVIKSEMTRLGVANTVSESVLAHGPKGLDRSYQLYEHEAEKRDALARWAAELRSIVGLSPSPLSTHGRWQEARVAGDADAEHAALIDALAEHADGTVPLPREIAQVLAEGLKADMPAEVSRGTAKLVALRPAG